VKHWVRRGWRTTRKGTPVSEEGAGSVKPALSIVFEALETERGRTRRRFEISLLNPLVRLFFGCDRIAGTGLDSSGDALGRFPPTDSGRGLRTLKPLIEERSGLAYNPKTDIVVAVVGIVVVAIRRPAISRIVVPRAAAFDCLPH